MAATRQPAVAGLFYPRPSEELRRQVQALLAGAVVLEGPAPKALIAPHAGYVYSGPIAASAYARLARAGESVRRVVLIGPAHRVPFEGIAASGADSWRTPIGPVPVDRDGVEEALTLSWVRILDYAHADEHSLEVHLPFLQVALGEFSVVPLVVGDATDEEVEKTLDTLWDGLETLIVISSDLSHYRDYESARELDRSTCRAVESLSPSRIPWDQACGGAAVRGLLRLARRIGMTVETLDLRNSGDTAGSRDRVVGYGAWAFYQS